MLRKRQDSTLLCVWAVSLGLLFFVSNSHCQKTAVLFPENTSQSRAYAEAVNENLALAVETTDLDLASAVLKTQAPASPFNQTAAEARLLGAGIGVTYLVLLRTDTLRRTSLEKEKYFEAYGAYFLVSSKTGMLTHWGIRSRESGDPELAPKMLLESAAETAAEIAEKIKADLAAGASSGNDEGLTELLPETDTSARFPLPYRRIKPVYTDAAKLYRVEATVDIEVSIDAKGNVTDTRIVRWAGYGLEESVERTVRSMQWRPADSKGKPFAMRVLLRYNFKDLDNPVD